MSDPHSPASHSAPLDDEPTTPMWLPVLGAALFLVVGILWAVSALPHASKSDAAQAATLASSGPSAAAPTAVPPRPPAPPTTAAAASAPRTGLIHRAPVVAGQP